MVVLQEHRSIQIRDNPMSDAQRWFRMSFVLLVGMPDVLLCAQQAVDVPALNHGRQQQAANAKSAGRKRPASKGLSASQLLVRRFDRQAPQIGDLLPDAAGFDSEGNEFELRSLQGHYTVLTFGCLT